MADSTPVLNPDQQTFLAEQRLAALATGRRDGSPQLSHIVYALDGDRILISVKSYTAKWHNALRQARVALLVHQGRKQLVIYGRVECISEDPERARLTALVFARLSGREVEPDDAFIATLDEQKRTILRLAPESATMND